jgi:predicted SprT family Zn-dependent metalloprotease
MNTARQYNISFRTVLNRLKKHLPPSYLVVCRRICFSKKAKVTGECWLEKKKFHIRIEKLLSNDAAIDTLLHEWAHILLWNEASVLKLDDHGPEWGVAYSRVWLEFEKQFLAHDVGTREKKDKEKSS